MKKGLLFKIACFVFGNNIWNIEKRVINKLEEMKSQEKKYYKRFGKHF